MIKRTRKETKYREREGNEETEKTNGLGEDELLELGREGDAEITI